MLFLPSTANLLREKEEWIGELESRLKELDRRILRLQKEYDQQVEESTAQLTKCNKEFLERTDWANRLSDDLRQRDEHITQLQREYDERTEWALRLNDELALCQAKLERLKQSKLYRFSKFLGLVPKI